MLELLANNFFEIIQSILTIALVVFGVWFANKKTKALYSGMPGMEFRRQLLMFGAVLLGIVLIIVGLPLTNELRGQLLSFVGILLSAAIALSSTTFLGNIMAGIMLRTIESIKIGDFIKVNGEFGRITEMDLLHVEIQTEDRNLKTMPNMHLVTNTVDVIRKSGTVIGIEVGLGYDTHRLVIENHLIEAAKKAGLKDPFVQIRNLGDFAVTYRIAGILDDLSSYIATHSALKRSVLDQLHDNGVEIMSPAFINTKALKPAAAMIPVRPTRGQEAKEADSAKPDNIVFDKAERAEIQEDFRKRLNDVKDELKAVESSLANKELEEDEKTLLEGKKVKLEARCEQLLGYINKLEARMGDS